MGEAKRVVPVVAIGILTFHPDNLYWIIVNAQRKAVMVSRGDLLVFSNQVRAHTFMLACAKKELQNNYALKQFSWADIIDRFSGQFSHALINCGKSGPESRVPLKKEILYPC